MGHRPTAARGIGPGAEGSAPLSATGRQAGYQQHCTRRAGSEVERINLPQGLPSPSLVPLLATHAVVTCRFPPREDKSDGAGDTRGLPFSITKGVECPRCLAGDISVSWTDIG